MISIIVPVYNEEKLIGRFLEKYLAFFLSLRKDCKIDFEIIVVINNTTDNSEKIVREFCKKHKEVSCLNLKERGKGLAIIEGFKNAVRKKSDFIGFVDADMSTSPEAFYELVEKIKSDKTIDGVIANRWDKKSVRRNQTLTRVIVSRGYNFGIRTLFLFPYRDTQCGAKIFRRGILEENIKKLVTSNWGFDAALLYCLRKESHAKIVSIPTIWNDRRDSKINLKKTPLLMVLSAIRLRLIHSPFKFIIRFYRKILRGRLLNIFKDSKNSK